MNICIDIGNTNAKVGIFNNDELVEVKQGLRDRDLIKLVKAMHPEHVLVSSVRKGVGKIVQQIKKFAPTLLLDRKLPLPFLNSYKSPETLGYDRIAAVAGAQVYYPGENCLVVDIGTCITFELINSKGIYEGGGISPGVEMRFKAMRKFTSGLPMVGSSSNAPVIGKTTKECMQSGVLHGIVSELKGNIELYRQFFNDLRIIFCGGGAIFFESKIKDDIFAIPNLVLIGLNRILRYNLND